MKETGQEGNKKEKKGNVVRAGEDSRRGRGKRRAGWAVVPKRDFHGAFHGTRTRLAQEGRPGSTFKLTRPAFSQQTQHS